MNGRRLGALIGTGLVAGFFGALFGVGGGIVTVPLLVLFVSFDQRRASATSLAAILVTSIAATATYALHGDVRPGAATMVGLPAVAGVLVGAALQQRLSTEKLTWGFALLLAGLGVRLLV